VSWKDALLAFTLTVLIMLFIWQGIAPEAIVIFPALLIIMEVVIQLRFRLGIICQFCGFDPSVYLKDPNQAAIRVRNHVEKLRGNPNTFMSDRAMRVLKKSGPAKAQKMKHQHVEMKV